MHLRYGLISTDDHVQEHPSVWTDRLSRARWGDRIPQIRELEDGTERWFVDEKPLDLPGIAIAAALMSDRNREPQRWEEVPGAAYDPAERLRAMDVDRVDTSVLYPTVAGVAGETFARLADPELELACVQAYNDWLIDEWAAASDRFVPQCIIPLSDPEAAAAEIRRAVARGHRGVLMPAVPTDLKDVPHVNEPFWDPIWAACQEAGVPVCFHAGASERIQMRPYGGSSPALTAALKAMTRPASTVFVLVNFIMSRILHRFPSLHAVFSESGIGWAAYVLEYADHQFEKDHVFEEGYDLKPSETFRRHCSLTGWYDADSVRTRSYIGVESITWASNFPLATSTWPNTWRTFDRWPEMPGEERQLILWGNAARIYRLDVQLERATDHTPTAVGEVR